MLTTLSELFRHEISVLGGINLDAFYDVWLYDVCNRTRGKNSLEQTEGTTLGMESVGVLVVVRQNLTQGTCLDSEHSRDSIRVSSLSGSVLQGDHRSHEESKVQNFVDHITRTRIIRRPWSGLSRLAWTDLKEDVLSRLWMTVWNLMLSGIVMLRWF